MDATATKMPADQGDDLAITVDEYAEFLMEIEEQPHWRHTADKEMDYADGNQLASELLQRQRELGIPPAVEDLVGPALLSIQGYEATIRSDWRVTANGQTGGQDVADALNFKLNEAERHSKADAACSNAFRPQIAVGIGWVEVKRESDPFKYPYRCNSVHRREIDWDFAATEDDLSDARYLRRKRWLLPKRIAMVFPQHRDLIMAIDRHGPSWWAEQALEAADGGSSTGLNNAWAEARNRTVQEDRWYNPVSKQVCLVELWYRRWVNVAVITTPDGRVVEYDEHNIAHNVAIASGSAKHSMAVVARVRRSYWLGPHLLDDGPTPYSHTHFPYVPFWGFREDATSIPYGYVRGMVYAQDSLNSGISKLRWGMAVVRTERTKGAVDMTDAQFRRQIGRVDADIVLNAEHMARQGARFDVKRDFQLNTQHFQLIQDSRQAIQRVSAVTSGFMGKEGTATSGVQEQTQVEQSNQSLARMMDSFRAGRSMVGELLLSMIVDDLGDKPQTIIIEGDAVREDREVQINKPEQDEMGYAYLSNDLQRTRLQVALEDVPSTKSYRGQQLNAMSEAVKSLPAQYQAAMLPFMVGLMDIPYKADVVKSIREIDEGNSPEAIKQKIETAVKDALERSSNDLKARELDLKYSPEKMRAEIDKIVSEVVKNNVNSSFAAMQAGEKIAMVPQIAPIADVVMQSSGWRQPSPGGQDPNFPQPGEAAAMNIRSPYVQGEGAQMGSEQLLLDQSAAQGDTSPLTPANPESAYVGANQGMDTIRAD